MTMPIRASGRGIATRRLRKPLHCRGVSDAGTDAQAKLNPAGIAPGGTLANVDYVKPYVDWDDSIAEIDKILLCDAQTSGGLIIVVKADDAKKLVENLRSRGITIACIFGEITTKGSGKIQVSN